MIGRWIDSLTDEQRDRIIEHPDPMYDGWSWWDSRRDCGCLVGCVLGREWGLEANVAQLCDLHIPHIAAGWRFPRFTKRFGAERMWRVVKARAAKRNRVNVVDCVAALS